MSDAWASPESQAASGSEPTAFRSMRLLSRVLLALLGLELVLMGVLTVADVLSAFVFPSALVEPAGAIDWLLLLMLTLGGLGTMGVILLALPLWVYWHYRAGANLQALGREPLQYSPAGHAFWWFVPFANLVLPYRTTLELYKASDPEGDADDWLFAAPPSLFPVWWGCWLIGNIVQNISTRLSFNDMVEASAITGLVATPFSMAALALYMQWVKTISDNQDALAATH